MKKSLLLFVMGLFVCSGIQAQIVSSRSVGIESAPQRPSETIWYLRGGLNMAGFGGDGAEGMSRKAAYDFAIGFQKPISTAGAYWGMDFGLGSRGFKADETSLMTNNIKVSPFTFGWKYSITDDIQIDGHVGAYAAFDYLGKIKAEGESVSMGDWEDLGMDWNRPDAGMNIGFGIWYDRFNLDFTFQRGFIEAASESKAYTSNILLRLGVAF
ncbi:PorT family protein [Parabacteroides sp.]